MANDRISHIPKIAGIYIFKDAQNTIIYVGKAKNLYKRVASYFHKKDADLKIQELITEHASIEFIATKNEAEALLLEAQMIKDYQPKYNTLLKQGNPFLYIVFTRSENPQMILVRNKKEIGVYFGPFTHKQDARRVYDYLTRTFKLFSCNKKLDNGCLDYHIGLCAGTCLKDFDKESYMARLQLAQEALSQNPRAFLKTVHSTIESLSKNRAFEKAAQVASYIKNWEVIFETLKAKYTETKYIPEIASKLAPFRRTAEDKVAALEDLRELLHLEKTPITIDCFDISHFQSRYIVGSCIRFTNGVPEKNKFRRFKIRSLAEQNDYAALQEIVGRRYREGDIPDLIIIDGGKGQLSSVRAILPEATIISLAKREETIFSETFPEGIKLDIQNPAAQLIISLRDYAHHFAVLYHKHLRGKEYK